MTKTIGRILAITSIAVLLALLAAMAGLSFFVDTDRGRLLMQSALNDRIEGSVSWSSGKISLWRGSIDLRDVRLYDRENRELAGLDRLHCLISLADLLRGALAIDRLLVEYPRADLQQSRQGHWNILDALAPVLAEKDHEKTADTPDSARPFIRNVILRDARILEGSATLYQVAENRRLTVEGIAMGFQGNLLKEQGQLKATLGPLKVEDDKVRVALNQVSLEGTYRKGSLEGLSVQAETDQSRVDLRGSLHNLITDPIMDLSLKVDLSPVELDQWITLDRVIREIVTVEADITGQPGNPTIALSLYHTKKDAPTADPPLLEALDISARLADRVLFLDSLDISTAGVTLHATGSAHMQEVFPEGFLEDPAEADWSVLSYTIDIQQHQTDLRRLPLTIPDDLEGVLASTIHLKGRGIDPQTLSAYFSAQADMEGLRFDSRGQPAAASLSAEGSLEKGTLRVPFLQLNTTGASLFFSGLTHLETGHIEGAAELSIPELEHLPLPLEGILAGSVNLKVFSEGTLDNPRLSLSGTADHLSWNELRVGKVGLAANLDETGRVTLENLTITRDESTVQARGTMDILEDGYHIREDPSFTAHMEALPFQIDDFTDHAEGSLTVSLDLGGTILNPTGVIAVEGRNIHTNFQNIGHLTLAADLGDEELRVTSFRVAAPSGEFIKGSGRVGLDRSFEMVLSSDGISRTSLDSLKDMEMFDGTAVFHLSGSGSFDDPGIDGEVELKNLVIADVPQEDFRGHLSFSDGRVSLRGMSNFNLDATYEVATGDFDLTLKAESMKLAPYFLMAGISDLRGILDATLHLEGNAADPLAATAHAAIDQIELHMEEMGTLSAGPVDVRAVDKTITLAPTVLHLPQDQSLNLEGNLHLDGSLDVSADGIFPLALAGIFTTVIDDFTGTARFSGQVKGTLSEPDMEADLEILKGGFRVNALASPAVHDITGTLTLRGSTVTLESLRGFMERGTFEADGTILLRDMKPSSMNIRVAGRDLPLDVPDMMNARLNASLTLQGRENAFNLDGDITILEALYYRDVRLRHLLADTITASTLPPPPPRPSGDSLLDSVRVDLSIRHREPLSVSNNLAHLDLVPDLRLTGTLAHPVVTGRITVTSGTIYYQRREFDVTRGVVDFLNPYRTEPTLDIESRVTIQDRRITLKVEGPPDRLVFNLTSDPPEEQGDILSLLLTGRTTGELTGQPGDATQTTANMVAAIVNATMAEDLRRTTGLDIFEIETTGDDDAEFAERFRVTMGKELSRRLAVKYSLQTEQGQLVQKISSEYQLLENILADVFQDNQGVFGGGIRFRLEFY